LIKMCHYFIAVFSFSSFCQILQFQLEICQYGVEMGRMSDYDIRPKPKVWTLGWLTERVLNIWPNDVC